MTPVDGSGELKPGHPNYEALKEHWRNQWELEAEGRARAAAMFGSLTGAPGGSS